MRPFLSIIISIGLLAISCNTIKKIPKETKELQYLIFEVDSLRSEIFKARIMLVFRKSEDSYYSMLDSLESVISPAKENVIHHLEVYQNKIKHADFGQNENVSKSQKNNVKKYKRDYNSFLKSLSDSIKNDEIGIIDTIKIKLESSFENSIVNVSDTQFVKSLARFDKFYASPIHRFVKEEPKIILKYKNCFRKLSYYHFPTIIQLNYRLQSLKVVFDDFDIALLKELKIRQYLDSINFHNVKLEKMLNNQDTFKFYNQLSKCIRKSKKLSLEIKHLKQEFHKKKSAKISLVIGFASFDYNGKVNKYIEENQNLINNRKGIINDYLNISVNFRQYQSEYRSYLKEYNKLKKSLNSAYEKLRSIKNRKFTDADKKQDMIDKQFEIIGNKKNDFNSSKFKISDFYFRLSKYNLSILKQNKATDIKFEKTFNDYFEKILFISSMPLTR